MKYLIIGALVLAVAIFWFIIKKKKANTSITFMPAGVSDMRVADLGLKQTPAKDLGILNEKRIRFPQDTEIGDGNYRAVHELAWIIDIVPPKGFQFQKDKFLKVFDYEWRKSFESEFYAYFPSTGTWSFAIAGDSPEEFDSLELALNLAPHYDDTELTLERVHAFEAEFKKRLAAFNVQMNISPRETAEQAVKRSKSLKALQKELDDEIVVVLQSDSQYPSKQFWNTLIDLGLKWGDGDLFHWNNYESGIGHDTFFSVWTTSNPGYFLPEDVANESMKPKDLIFGFSIPRSADPLTVYQVMIESVEYCQSKLGGKILDDNGAPLDKEIYKKRIEALIQKMKDNGFEPGQGIILRLI